MTSRSVLANHSSTWLSQEGGREVETNAGILVQELPHQRAFVSRKIVEDDVNVLASRTQRDDLLQAGNEVLTGMPCSGFAVDAAGSGIQRRIQGDRSMSVVFEPMAFGAAGRKRQHRIEPVQRLNGGLLVDTEDGRVLRRVQIEADYASGLALEIGIVAGQSQDENRLGGSLDSQRLSGIDRGGSARGNQSRYESRKG